VPVVGVEHQKPMVVLVGQVVVVLGLSDRTPLLAP
jgi:hypothetical protein